MSDTQSVLDLMTAGIMGMKQDKASQLTPVGMEKPPPTIADARGDVFPHDGGLQSQIVFSAKIIRENLFQMQAQLTGMEDCLQSIEREAGLREPLSPTVNPAAPDTLDTLLTFEEKFAAQQADAQAQAFKAADEVKASEPQPAQPSSGWVCPEHGDSHLTTLTSRKGRQYKSCVGCSQFERIA